MVPVLLNKLLIRFSNALSRVERIECQRRFQILYDHLLKISRAEHLHMSPVAQNVHGKFPRIREWNLQHCTILKLANVLLLIFI